MSDWTLCGVSKLYRNTVWNMIRGILGTKIGMTEIFSQDGRIVPVTVVQAGPCIVTQIRTNKRDGYEAVQIGYGKAKHLNKALRGHMGNRGQFKHLREFPVDAVDEVEPGQQVDVGLFEVGEKVDVIGRSKGKGFQGGMKRHGFGGGPRTHGQSDRARAPGSIGAGTTPGKVLKGQRMAGHMGNNRITVKNLQVVEIDTERELLLLKGAIPGARNTLLEIRKK